MSPIHVRCLAHLMLLGSRHLTFLKNTNHEASCFIIVFSVQPLSLLLVNIPLRTLFSTHSCFIPTYVEQSPSSEAIGNSASQEVSTFYGSDSSFPYSQEPVTKWIF
jgi:hypothetical protein